MRKTVRRVRKHPTKASKLLTFSYKNANLLGKFMTEQGTIIPRYETGLTEKQQRRLTQEIKRARHLAILPFTQTLF